MQSCSTVHTPSTKECHSRNMKKKCIKLWGLGELNPVCEETKLSSNSRGGRAFRWNITGEFCHAKSLLLFSYWIFLTCYLPSSPTWLAPSPFLSIAFMVVYRRQPFSKSQESGITLQILAPMNGVFRTPQSLPLLSYHRKYNFMCSGMACSDR